MSLYQVTILSISVSATDDGWLGGDLEATFAFVVNGQVQFYGNRDLDTGVHTIGLAFLADVPSEQSQIIVTVSGVEDDPVWDDTLPGFTRVWGQSENWGVGFQTGSASDSNITYTLNYQINEVVEEMPLIISEQVLVDYALERAKTRKNAQVPSTKTLISWSLDRLRRAGWRFVQEADKQYIFKGYGTFPALLERRYARKPEKKG